MESKWSGWVLILSVCLGSYQVGIQMESVVCQSPLPPTAGASPLHECSERPEDWCRDAVTAAKCGALQLCQLTVWDQALGQKGIPCHLCQVVVSVVGKILQDNRTEEKLRLFLDKKCQYLPFQDWSVKCKKMVDTGILILVQLGKQVMSDPKVVCGTIKLCQPRESPTGALKFQKPPPAPAGPARDFADLVSPFIANVPLLLHPQDLPRGEEMEEVCGNCLQLVAAVQLELGTNKDFTQELVARAKQACEELAPPMAQQCKHYLAEYVDTTTQLLRYMLAEDPMELCGQVGLCSSTSVLPLHTLLTEKVLQALSEPGADEGTTPLCEVCQFAVKAAESLLENNVTEEQLVNNIEKVCYMLPHGVIGQCKDFVDSYGKAVVIMLLEATDPAAICTMLHCCPRSGDTHPGEPGGHVPATLEQLVMGPGGFCNVCQIVITYFDNELLKNETLAELGDVLEKGCELLPPPLTGKVSRGEHPNQWGSPAHSHLAHPLSPCQCEALVVQYEPAAMRLLVQMMDPNFVCTKIRACDSPEEDLLGSDPCVWGPHYWCKNMATAVECHAVEHCRRHLWN
ncbi:PREDICTED: LOW QUALITY PROTEIN: proactivator polypeptide-like [Merops nubicus]|uniref:LOW QUALITY PROTEIN: proactivator polypeptide-like n=1 Tax=Merops nubicus TaxID=57421 RepID=UPI0004F056A7|nr:PREDICTED: LOW QUALITY PROTEIN: proactivator polypeptide-like [Merops nubicus]